MTTELLATLPDLAGEMTRLLAQVGRSELAEQVKQLRIVERCRCGDAFCATFYTTPPPAGGWGAGHENVVLDAQDGDIVLDVVHGKIVCVEILNRDQLRKALVAICP